jgi:hypothetical protein
MRARDLLAQNLFAACGLQLEAQADAEALRERAQECL